MERMALLLGPFGGKTGGLMGYNSGHENMGMATVGFFLGFFRALDSRLAISWVSRMQKGLGKCGRCN
jgi:hypothetical protein